MNLNSTNASAASNGAKGKLHGIFTPFIVPLDARGRINEAELRRYIDWLIEKGVHGLYPNGSTGEFTRFVVEERRKVIEITCSQVRGRVPILAGAAEANVEETLKACEAYQGFGATAVAIVSPFYYKLSSESIYAYFKEIAVNSPIDVTLYNIPMFASPIDVPTIRRLAELPRITGIKDSSGDMAHMIRMMAAIKPFRPDFVFLTGWEAALVPMLVMGCDGGTNGISGIAPELTRKLYDLTRANQLDEARALQMRLMELFDALLYNADFPEGFRAAAELRGFNMGRGRQPMSPSQQIDRAGLQRVLHCILSDFGYIDAPPESCPTRTGNMQEDRVSQITQAVLHNLRQQGVL